MSEEKISRTPSTRGRRLLILAAAVVVAGVLVAPVVLSTQHGSGTGQCDEILRFRAHRYAPRTTPGAAPTQGVAIGVGVLSGCGRAPANVNVRSLSGVRPARAIAIETDPRVFVRGGVCPDIAGARLERCLRG